MVKALFVLLVLKTVPYVEEQQWKNATYVPKDLFKYLITVLLMVDLMEKCIMLFLSLVVILVLKDKFFQMMEHSVKNVDTDVIFVLI